MTSSIQIQPVSDVEAIVDVPGSKSLTNRALLIAALAEGKSRLTNVLDSEDSRVMIDALRTLGLNVETNLDAKTVVVQGTGGRFPNRTAEIFVGNSGTTARFLTAALAGTEGSFRLFGKPRMHERPIGDLLLALRSLGAQIVSENGNDCLPIRIDGVSGLKGTASVAGSVSSQFLSGLLMAAVAGDDEIVLDVAGDLVSVPYIKMTLAVMKSFGVSVETDEAFRYFKIAASSSYRPTEYAIEPDASAASYFFAIPAIVGGKITVRGLSFRSLQGDVRFVDCLAAAGCLVEATDREITVSRPRIQGRLTPLLGIDVDMNDISDTVQTLSVVSLFAESPTRIRGVAHIRHKETDRIAAVVAELRKFGVEVDEFDDGLTVWAGKPGTSLHGATIETYDDHRMAMSFALAGLTLPNVFIQNPECVQKTYPNFFDDLKKVSQPNR